MQRFIACGGITADPQLTENGDNNYCKFSIAVADTYDRDKTDFFNCIAFGKIAKNIVEYTKKGSQVLIEGKIHIVQSTKNGISRQFTNVVIDTCTFLKTPNHKPNDSTSNNDFESSYDDLEITDDMLPF